MESWFKVEGKNRHPHLNRKHHSYANAIKTRYGVSEPTLATALRDPLGARQSPRIAKRVQIVETASPRNTLLREGGTRNYERQQRTAPSLTVSPRAAMSKRRRTPPQGGEMFLEDDEVHLPLTFPMANLGTPTPGTTNLNEPPEGDLPAPILHPTGTPEREDSPLIEISQSSIAHPLTLMRFLCRHIGHVQDKANALEVILFDIAKAEEQKAPIQVQVVQQINEGKMIAEKYSKAQTRHRMKFSMATLLTLEGQLQVDGRTPRVAVIDTGAGSIILGRDFSKSIDRCQQKYLAFGDSFVTAAGQDTPALGRTKLILDFTLAKGTSKETTIKSHAMIADTNTYDVLLGMDFLGAVFGYLDPLTEEFLWRVDCRETKAVPSRLARLPATYRGTNEERRNAYTIKVITCSSDLQDAILGDESIQESIQTTNP